MSYCIIIRGPAGVGKTTVGDLLAQALSGECIHIDKVLKENGLEYVKDEKWVPPENFLKVNKILESYINSELEKDKKIIIEGNFYHKSVIEDILGKIKHSNFAFDLKAEMQECIDRDVTRNTHNIGPDSIKAVFNLVSQFDYGQPIDTNGKTPEEVAQEILACLNEG